MNKILSTLFLSFLLFFGSIDIALCNSTHSLSIQVDTTDTLKIEKSQPDSIANNTSNIESDIVSSIKSFIESHWVTLISILVSILIPLFTWERFWLWINRKRDLDYSRYLKNILTKYREENNYEQFPDIKLIPKSSEDVNSASTIPDILSTTNKVHIKGKPGAGKTSLIKNFFIELSKKRQRGESDLIPIYLEYRGKDLFNQIRSNFSSNELFTNTELLTRDWIKTQLMKGKYIICIDDVHNLLTDPNRKENSEILNLLDYRNKYILISRDHINSFSFLGFDHYRIHDLSNDWELITQVLKIYANDTKVQRIRTHLKPGVNDKLIELYNTPQRLKFLAKVFDPADKLEDNKSSLFDRFLEIRDEEERRKTSVKPLDLSLKKRILGFIAFNLFSHKEDDKYSASELELRELLKRGLDEFEKNYGLSGYSVDLIKDILFRQGYLIKTNSSIRFEHDQWQEFFAALEIYNQEKTIEPFLLKSYGKEVALFVSGLFKAKKYSSKSIFWDKFWEDLIREDYFLTGYCIKNRVRDWKGEIQQEIPDETDFRPLYEKLLLWYERIIKMHFPALIEEFIPKSSEEAGILVEKNRENKVWHNYYSIESEEAERVSIFDYTEVIKHKDFPDSLEYYKRHFSIPSLHNLAGWPHVPDSPIVIAYKDVKRQLTDFVQKGRLIETRVMNEEALFIEAVSLSAKLKGRLSGTSDISKHNVLSVGELLSGIERFKNDEFENSIKVPEARHSNLGRRVAFKEVEERLKKYIQNQNLENEDALVPSNADLIDVLKHYRLIKEELSTEHREFLINISARFYNDVYKNYKEVIETNFPTTKYYFRSYSFPIQIFLIREESDNKKYFGKRLVYYDVKNIGLNKPVNVKIVNNEENIAQIKDSYKGYNYYWGLNSFSTIEPLRNAVYRLIKDEYRELSQ